MQYRSIKGFSGLGQLGILLSFLGLGFILVMLLQFFIGYQLIPSGGSAERMGEEMIKALEKPENINYARLSQVLSTFFLFFVPTISYLIICHGKNIFWLGFNKHINAWQILVGFFLIFFANIIASPLADLSKDLIAHYPHLNIIAKSMEDSYNDQVMALSNLKSWGEFLMAIIIMAFFPALFEEVFFRGALQNLFERWWKAPVIAVVVTSLLFSIIHMSIYLFLSRFVLGFILGLMYLRCRNLWVNIIAHFLNNSVALIQLFWISSHKEKVELDKLDPKFPLWGGLIAVVFTYGLFLLFKKVSDTNRNLVAFEEQNLQDLAGTFHPPVKTNME